MNLLFVTKIGARSLINRHIFFYAFATVLAVGCMTSSISAFAESQGSVVAGGVKRGRPMPGPVGLCLDLLGYELITKLYWQCLDDAYNEYLRDLRIASQVFRSCVILESRNPPANRNISRCHANYQTDVGAADDNYFIQATMCATRFAADGLDTLLPSLGPIGPGWVAEQCGRFIFSETAAQ